MCFKSILYCYLQLNAISCGSRYTYILLKRLLIITTVKFCAVFFNETISICKFWELNKWVPKGWFKGFSICFSKHPTEVLHSPTCVPVGGFRKPNYSASIYFGNQELSVLTSSFLPHVRLLNYFFQYDFGCFSINYIHWQDLGLYLITCALGYCMYIRQ